MIFTDPPAGAASNTGFTSNVMTAIYTGQGAYPWSVKGVVSVAAGATVTNPTPDGTGFVGEISSLPYVVPSTQTLVILGMSLSSDTTGGMEALLKLKITGGGFTDQTVHTLIKYNESLSDNYTTALMLPHSYSLRIDLINAATATLYLRFLIYGILVNN